MDPGRRDWVGLYDANGNCVQWQYLDGTHTLPATGVTTASVTFTLPATTGAFRAQLYNRGYQLIATSETILTAGSSVALGAANGTAGGTTTATIVNGPGPRATGWACSTRMGIACSGSISTARIRSRREASDLRR